MFFFNKKLIFFISCLLCCLLINVGYATQIIKPQQVVIHNNVQANVSLSNKDINRVFVRGEKITAIDAPNGLLSAHNDSSGSIYLNIYGSTPFTAFVTTNNGLHFSLLILPKSEPGKTIEFKVTGYSPKQVKNYSHFNRQPNEIEKRSPYQKLLVELIRQTMLGKVPPGYSAISASAFSKIPMFKTNSITGISQKVSAGFIGGQLAIRIVKVSNITHRGKRLYANEFYTPLVRAVAISQQYIPKGSNTYVYEVISNA